MLRANGKGFYSYQPVWAVTTASSHGSIDSYADAGDSARRAIKRSRNHGVDFLAPSDHHDAQVYKTTGAYNKRNSSGAIGIDVIGASDGGPLDRGWKAVE